MTEKKFDRTKNLVKLKKCKGYFSLLEEVERDKKNHPEREIYEEKLDWVIDRVLLYAEKLNLPASKLLNKWEQKRSYWYMNYYQDYNMPKIEGEKIFVFDTIDDFFKSVPSKKFRCPLCGGISNDPYKCTSVDEKNKNKTCGWKVHGLLNVGFVNVFIKKKLKVDKIFLPIDWAQEAEK